MTTPAKMVRYLVEAAEVIGGFNEREEVGDLKVAARNREHAAMTAIERRMERDRKKIEELTSALDYVLSEAGAGLGAGTLNGHQRRMNALRAVKDRAQAALKRGPYAPRGREERP